MSTLFRSSYAKEIKTRTQQHTVKDFLGFHFRGISFVYTFPKFFFIKTFQRDKVKSLTDNISDTRTGVTDVKSFIDGMRNGRDTKMQEMTNLKNKLKDQVRFDFFFLNH